MASKKKPSVAEMRTLLDKLPEGDAKEQVKVEIAKLEAAEAAESAKEDVKVDVDVDIDVPEVKVPEAKPKKERKPRAKSAPKAKAKKPTRFVFEKKVDGGKEVKVVEAMTEEEAKEAMGGTDFEFVKQITRGRSPREGFVADKKAPAKKKEADKPKRKPRATKEERTSMAKAAGMSESRAQKISQKVATGKKRGRKPLDKERWLFEMPLKTQAGKVKRKIVEATSEQAAVKAAGKSYSMVRKLSESEKPKTGQVEMEGFVPPPPKQRGRPKGSKNKVKAAIKEKAKPSKKSQAAIKAKSEDIAEGIAIADKVSKRELRLDLADVIARLEELTFRYDLALEGAEKVVGNLQTGQQHLNDMRAALKALAEDDKKMARGGKVKRGDYESALQEAIAMGVNFERDFHAQSIGGEMDELATKYGYRKPKSASGSKGRMFFQKLQRMDSKKMAEGGTTEGKPKVESLTEVFMLMDGTDIAYDDMGDAEKMFGGDPLTPQELVDKLAVDHDIYVMDAAPELFDLPDGDDEDDDEFYTGDVKDGVTIDDIEDAIEDELQGDNSYNYSAPFVFDVRFTKTRDAYDPQIMLAREHRGGDVRGNYGEYKAFSIDADTNPFYGKMSLEIETNKGRISLDAESLEGYNFYVNSDETGTFEDDSTIDRDDIADAFDFGKVKSETLYINDY